MRQQQIFIKLCLKDSELTVHLHLYKIQSSRFANFSVSQLIQLMYTTMPSTLSRFTAVMNPFQQNQLTSHVDSLNICFVVVSIFQGGVQYGGIRYLPIPWTVFRYSRVGNPLDIGNLRGW